MSIKKTTMLATIAVAVIGSILFFYRSYSANAIEPIKKVQQKPLTAYYGKVYDNLSMAKWITEPNSIRNDSHKFLAIGLTELKLEKNKYATPLIIDRFISAAFASPLLFSPFADNGNDHFVIRFPGYIYHSWGIGGDNFLEKFRDDYPWLVKLLEEDHKAPRMPAINKWTMPVLVSTGLPNDLFPENADKNSNNILPFKPPYENFSSEKEMLVEKTVLSLAPAFSEVIGLPITFRKHNEEISGGYANLRIVLTDQYDNQKSVYRLFQQDVSRNSPDRDGFPDSPRSFRQYIETQFFSAVKFTPNSPAALDGYFIPDADNNIRFSVCYIWSGHSDIMIRALTSECLLRSLGLPGDVYTSEQAFLKSWNKKTPLIQSSDNENIPRAPAPIDYLLLGMLYHPDLKSGSSPYYTKTFYEEYFTEELETFLERRAK